MPRALVRLGFVCLALMMTVGCASSASMNSATTALASQVPGCHLEREEHIKLGPFTLALARTLAGLAGESLDEETADILADVRRVEVATYSVRPPLEPTAELSLAGLETSLGGKGWSPMVRERDGADLTWVFVQEALGGEIRGLFVISVDRHEMEVVRIEGRLDRVIAAAIAADRTTLDFLIDS